MQFEVTRRIHGPAIKAIREAQGLKNVDLAVKAGFSRGTLSRIEQGTREVAPATMARFASALCVPLDAISYPFPAILSGKKLQKVPA